MAFEALKDNVLSKVVRATADKFTDVEICRIIPFHSRARRPEK